MLFRGLVTPPNPRLYIVSGRQLWKCKWHHWQLWSIKEPPACGHKIFHRSYHQHQ